LPVAFFADGKFWVNNHAHIVRGFEGIADDEYLKHWFAASDISGYITGAAQPKLSQANLRRVQIELPPLNQQRRIASILSAYDDLIENNTRRIAILEEMARALYQEWFVHFRFPGHEHMPLVDSPLGPIPKGWEVDTLQNLAASFQDGDWIETKDQGGDAYRLLQVSNIGMGEFVETGNWRFITQETFERLRCCEVLENDLLISRMPKPIGRAWMVTRMPFRMVTAVDVAILRVNEDRADRHYLYCALNSPSNLDRVLQHSTGTTRARIARRNLASLLFLVPSLELQQRFAKLASSAIGLSALLREKSTNLRASRDLLLPRLISGEIDVSALSEESIAEAAD
jgi:type I restriction enzyme, S subunit